MIPIGSPQSVYSRSPLHAACGRSCFVRFANLRMDFKGTWTTSLRAASSRDDSGLRFYVIWRDNCLLLVIWNCHADHVTFVEPGRHLP